MMPRDDVEATPRNKQSGRRSIGSERYLTRCSVPLSIGNQLSPSFE